MQTRQKEAMAACFDANDNVIRATAIHGAEFIRRQTFWPLPMGLCPAASWSELMHEFKCVLKRTKNKIAGLHGFVNKLQMNEHSDSRA